MLPDSDCDESLRQYVASLYDYHVAAGDSAAHLSTHGNFLDSFRTGCFSSRCSGDSFASDDYVDVSFSCFLQHDDASGQGAVPDAVQPDGLCRGQHPSRCDVGAVA